jgi:glycosyltransferase involved in cell wall biosynthesis
MALSKISVIVPCYNRAKYLDKLLQSLSWSSLNFDQYELIICNDGGADNAELVASQWLQKGMDVSHIRVRESGEIRNGATARNVGIKAAKYATIINTDPEIIFISDVLAQVREKITPDVFLSAGHLYEMTEQMTEENFRMPDRQTLSAQQIRDQVNGRPNLVDLHVGSRGLHAAFACHADALKKIRGYDESMASWGCEDSQIILRLEKMGMRRVFLDEAITVHQWHPAQRGGDGGFSGKLPNRTWDYYYQQSLLKYDDFNDINKDGWGEPATNSDRKLTSPARHQAIFDSHLLEAIELRNNRLFDEARSMILYSFARPWEKAEENSADLEEYGNYDSEQLLANDLPNHYSSTNEALFELLNIEIAAGKFSKADELLASIRNHRLEIDEREIDYYQALIHFRQNELPQAYQFARKAIADEGNSEHLFLAIELALRLADYQQAAKIIAHSLERLTEFNAFDQIQLSGFLKSLQEQSSDELPFSATAVEKLQLACPCTEFFYNAAIRSYRRGYFHATCSLLQQFLAVKPPAEARLYLEGYYFLAKAMAILGEKERARLIYQQMVEAGILDKLADNMQADLDIIFG